MGALDGISVLDVGLLVQGPQAAALLGDLGASVIKVELPGFGDQARWLPASATDPRAPYFLACNRGKRSITLDLRRPEGREVFLVLTERADVVISNFKPGTMDEWGLDYETLAARNPRLVYATGSTFGPIGPAYEGADLAGQAAGGIIATTGRDGDPLTPVGATIADHLSSQHLAAGILAALLHRERSGRGQRVDVSLVGGAIWAQASEMTAYLLSGEVPKRANRGHSLINGGYGIFPTADGYVALVGVPPQARDAFLAAIEMPTLFDDPRWASPFMSYEHKQALFDALEPVFRRKTTAEWVAAFREVGVRCAPVRDYAEIAADPQVHENGYLRRVEHPTYGEITVVGSPLRMSETPPEVAAAAPELGQHTEEILLELGYDWDRITALRDAGVI